MKVRISIAELCPAFSTQRNLDFAIAGIIHYGFPTNIMIAAIARALVHVTFPPGGGRL